MFAIIIIVIVIFIALEFNCPFFAGFGDSDHTSVESLPPSINAVTSTSSLFDTAVAGESLHLTCHLFSFTLIRVYALYVTQGLCFVSLRKE